MLSTFLLNYHCIVFLACYSRQFTSQYHNLPKHSRGGEAVIPVLCAICCLTLPFFRWTKYNKYGWINCDCISWLNVFSYGACIVRLEIYQINVWSGLVRVSPFISFSPHMWRNTVSDIKSLNAQYATHHCIHII